MTFEVYTVLGNVPASFRDPCGFMVLHGGEYMRIVTDAGASHYERLMRSGLYAELADEGLLVAHREEPLPRESMAGIYKMLRPEQVRYVSYPFEWCFSQLRDAALLTLELQERALSRGMSLKDASAFNVQFEGGKPVFIDTLSFERDLGGPWAAYEQFCRHFLAPLLLMANRDMRLNRYTQADLNGLPLDLASRLLGWRSYLSPGALLHVHLHSRAQKRVPTAAPVRGRSGWNHLKRNLVASLRRAVKAIASAGGQTSEWGAYAGSAAHYDSEARRWKQTLVEAELERVRPSLVYDCGGNTGAYGRLAASRDMYCVLLDSDPCCIEKAYVMERGENRNLLPLVMDLRNPTPKLGFNADERSGLLDRPRADLVLALAVVHHLRLRDSIPFAQMARFFHGLGRTLLVEFVGAGDPQLARMTADSRPLPEDYTPESFLKAFETRFHLRRWSRAPGMARHLMVFEEKR